MYQQRVGMNTEKALRRRFRKLLLLLGLVASVPLLYSAWQVTVALVPSVVYWSQSQCQITESKVVTITRVSVRRGVKRPYKITKVQLAYAFQTAQGQTITGSTYDWFDDLIPEETPEAAQAIVQSYQVGKTYPCWYNTILPTVSVLTRTISSDRWYYIYTHDQQTFFALGIGLWGVTLLFFLPLFMVIWAMVRAQRKRRNVIAPPR